LYCESNQTKLLFCGDKIAVFFMSVTTVL